MGKWALPNGESTFAECVPIFESSNFKSLNGHVRSGFDSTDSLHCNEFLADLTAFEDPLSVVGLNLNFQLEQVLQITQRAQRHRSERGVPYS